MSRRPHGRALVDPSNPSAFGTCDRCGFVWNLTDLQWQFQWVGPKLQNLRILVCEPCLDEPAQFLRTIVIPPDPPPLFNTRSEPYSMDEDDFRVTEGKTPATRVLDTDGKTPRVDDSSANENV